MVDRDAFARLGLHLPASEDEFQAMMRAVDECLRSRDVAPPSRPLQAFLGISGTLGLGLNLLPADREPRPGSYSGDDLTLRVFRWFDDHYGDRLKIDFGPGRVFLLLRGAPWSMRMPGVYGTVEFFVSPTERSSDQTEDLRRLRTPRYNVLDSIDELTEALRCSLDDAELESILQHFLLGFYSTSLISELSDQPLIPEARSDIGAAVHFVMDSTPHFGQSRWSSLQAAEKLLKAFLVSKETKYPFSHSLADLAALATNAGMPRIAPRMLDLLRCTPGIRYGDEPSTMHQAFSAHRASLSLCLRAAKAIQKAAR